MIQREVRVTNRAGIHARPAAMIVQTASRYDSRRFGLIHRSQIRGRVIPRTIPP